MAFQWIIIRKFQNRLERNHMNVEYVANVFRKIQY